MHIDLLDGMKSLMIITGMSRGREVCKNPERTDLFRMKYSRKLKPGQWRI
jgi:hypothetical protein